MIQMVILALAAVCLLAGGATLVTGKISLSKTSTLTGGSARAVGIGLLVAAAAMAGFALFILPGMK
jgi:hypothetical protein